MSFNSIRPTVNPILQREMRARWRGWRGFMLLFGWSAALSLLVTIQYANGISLSRSDEGARYTAFTDAGHQIFSNLTIIETMAWMALATLLGAGSIAREREIGLLEGMQLAPLHPLRIVAGKFWAIISFLFLIQLTLLPLQTVLFGIGGVGPEEMLQCAVVQLCAAATCTALGIACSAWCRRTALAVVAAVVVVLTSLAAGDICYDASGYANSYLGQNLPMAWPPKPLQHQALYGSYTSRQVFFLAVQGSPFSALQLIDDDEYLRPAEDYYPDELGLLNPNTGAVVRNRMGVLVTVPSSQAHAMAIFPTWLVSLVGCALLVCAALAVAWRGAAKIWPEVGMVRERRRFLTWQPGKRAAGLKLGARLQVVAVAPESAGTPPAWYNASLLSWVRCRNPIMQRELRQLLQLPRLRAGRVAWLRGLLPVAIIGLYVYWAFYVAFLNGARSAADPFWPICVVLMLLAANQGAKSFARERESGNWQALTLTPLPPLHIIAGKFMPLAVSIALFELALATPMLIRLNPSWRWIGHYGMYENYVAAGLVTYAAAIATGSWAMLISWFCKRAPVALSWTIGSALVLQWAPVVVGSYILTELRFLFSAAYELAYGILFGFTPITSPRSAGFDFQQGSATMLFNPYLVLHRMEFGDYYPHNYGYGSDYDRLAGNGITALGFITSIALTGTALLLLLALGFLMRRHHGREKERTRFVWRRAAKVEG